MQVSAGSKASAGMISWINFMNTCTAVQGHKDYLEKSVKKSFTWIDYVIPIEGQGLKSLTKLSIEFFEIKYENKFLQYFRNLISTTLQNY